MFFRCDAGTRIGTGHVMRCLTLASALRARGLACEFACRQQPGDLLERVRAEGYVVHALPAASQTARLDEDRSSYASWLGAEWQEDLAQTLRCIGAGPVDWLVVDHYAIDQRWEARARGACRRLMVIDDLADRAHDCDLLLDQNFGRTAADYAALVPPACRILAGSRHALLRPEFSAQRERSLARRERRGCSRLLVMMGGVDRDNASARALRAIAAAGAPADARVTVVLGPHAPWLREVEALAARMPYPARVLAGTDEMATLMAEADLAIGSGGGGTYERIYMGLPSLVEAIAANQAPLLRQLSEAGLFTLYQGEDELVALLRGIFAAGGLPPPPAVVADGRALVCDAMAGPQVELVRPRPWDLRRTFRWLQDPVLRAQFLLRGAPERGRHFAYWRRLLEDPAQRVYSILADGRHVGNAGLRDFNRERGRAELWIYLGEAATRGGGVGARALRQLEQGMRGEAGIDRLVLHVGRENAVARDFYARAGYVATAPDGASDFDPQAVVRMEKRL